MFSAASKLGFTVTAASVLAAVLYAFGTGDRNGFALLMFTGAVFFAVAVGAFFFVGPTELAVEAAQAQASPSPVRPDVPAPSPWPLGVAAGIALAVVAVAAGTLFLVLGLLLVAGTGLIWFSQAWREHPSWTPAMTDRLNQRFVVPLGLPALTIVLVGIGAVSFSRIFLAASSEVAPIIAIVAALAILGGCFVVASADDMGRTAIRVIAAFAVILVLGAGAVGAFVGERQFHPATGETVELQIRNNAFSRTEVEVPAGEAVTVVLDNRAISTPHNFTVLAADGTVVFQGKPVTGPRITTYTLTIDEPGQYRFQSDQAPEQLNGTLTVTGEPDGGHGGSGSGDTKASEEH